MVNIFSGALLSNSPPAMPSLRLWANADYPLGAAPAPADGTGLSAWSNLAGGTFQITQGTAGSQPKYKTGVINGRAGILWDGANDVMVISTTSGGSSQSIINPLAAFTLLIGFKALDTTTRNLIATRNSSSEKITIAMDNTGVLYSLASTTPTTKSTAFSDTSNPNIVALTCDGSSGINQYLNNTLSVGNAATSSTTASNGVLIGSTSTAGTGVPFTGYMTDILLYTRVLSTNEFSLATKYISNQRGVTIS